MEMISFSYKRIFFLKVAKFRYLLAKFLVQNDFAFSAKGNGSNVCFFSLRFSIRGSGSPVAKASVSKSKGREFDSR